LPSVLDSVFSEAAATAVATTACVISWHDVHSASLTQTTEAAVALVVLRNA